jgi:hypothetical protein
MSFADVVGKIVLAREALIAMLARNLVLLMLLQVLSKVRL